MIAEYFYYVGVPVVSLIVWLVKLEAKANRNAELTMDVQLQLKEHLRKCEDSQLKIIEMLIEIKDKD